MADPHPADDYQRGSQEISERLWTFGLFVGLTKWGSLAMAVSILFLTVWFMPNGSFIGAAVVAVVASVAGYFALKSKPAAH